MLRRLEAGEATTAAFGPISLMASGVARYCRDGAKEGERGGLRRRQRMRGLLWMEWTTERTVLMFMGMLYLTGVMLRGRKRANGWRGAREMTEVCWWDCDR